MRFFSTRYIRTLNLAALATITFTGFSLTAASAQTLLLHNGDSATVSGTGTVGIIGGMPISNSTSTYIEPGGGGPDYAVTTIGNAAFTLANGGTLTATQSNFGLITTGSGPITITGGTITSGQSGTGLFASGSGPVIISGGTLKAGAGGAGLIADGNGSMTITGGTITGGDYGYGLQAYGNSSVSIGGGTITAGFAGFGLYASGNGVINLFSQGNTPFLVNGVLLNDMTLNSMVYPSGIISGTLANGDLLNTHFYDASTINLNIGTPPAAVPEASTTISFGLLLALGLGGVVMAAKKKTGTFKKKTAILAA